MNKADLKRSLEAELLKIQKQDKIYGVGETRYDLMIKDCLSYIENSIPKQELEKDLKILEKTEVDNTANFWMKHGIEEYLKKLLEVK